MRKPTFESQETGEEKTVRILSTPSCFAKKTYFCVQETGNATVSSEVFVNRKHLPSYLVLFTLSGSGYLQYQGSIYSLHQGDAFFIDCMNPHCFGASPPHNWSVCYVHLYGATSRSYYDMYMEDGGCVVKLHPDSPAPALIAKLQDLAKTGVKEAELLSSQEIVKLLTEMVLGKDQCRRGKKMEFINEAMQYIDEHYPEDITLQTLSNRFNVSKFHLQKKFKQYTGVSPNEYLIRARLQRAKEYLRDTDLPVHDIAAAVGMENVSYFIKIFKDNEHLTPLTYRKRWECND